MPISFTPDTPIIMTEFNFEGLLESQAKYLGRFSFFPEWKKYWLNIFLEKEDEVKGYIRKFPDSNPILQRIKHYPSASPLNYEMYSFKHTTDFGVFNLHFDIESMKHFQTSNRMNIEEIHISNLYVNPDTPLLKNKIQDKRIPYFIRMYGMEKFFVCADGNKRIQARMKNGETSFEGYVFNPEHYEVMFFESIDMYYYFLMYELNTLFILVQEGYKEKEIYESTQMFFQSRI